MKKNITLSQLFPFQGSEPSQPFRFGIAEGQKKALSPDTEHPALAKARLFQGIGPKERQEMLRCLSPIEKRYEKGEYVFRNGQQVSAVGLVLEGGVHIQKEDYWGNRSILTEVSQGQAFGEAYACQFQEAADAPTAQRPGIPVSVVATQRAVVLFLEVSRVLSLCPSACPFHARLVRNLVGILAERSLALTEKIQHLSQRRLREKLLSYLSDAALGQKEGEFTIPYNRQELADYLSVDRSALSSELCRLRREGVLECCKNRFRFL